MGLRAKRQQRGQGRIGGDPFEGMVQHLPFLLDPSGAQHTRGASTPSVKAVGGGDRRRVRDGMVGRQSEPHVPVDAPQPTLVEGPRGLVATATDYRCHRIDDAGQEEIPAESGRRSDKGAGPKDLLARHLTFLVDQVDGAEG